MLPIVKDKTQNYGENGQTKKIRSISYLCNRIKKLSKSSI